MFFFFPFSELSSWKKKKKEKKTAVSAGSGRSHHAAQLLVALSCAVCVSNVDRSISTPKETKRSNQVPLLLKVALLR